MSGDQSDVRMRKRARQRAFLVAVSLKGTVMAGCRAAGVSRSAYRHWRKDEGFVAQFDGATDDYRESLVEEATVRGRDGWYEPVLYKGLPCFAIDAEGKLKLDDDFEPIPLTVRKHSDRLLEGQLKAHDQRYRDKGRLELTGENGGPLVNAVTIEFVDAGERTDPDDAEAHDGDQLPE